MTEPTMDFVQLMATYGADERLRAEAIAEGTPTLQGVELLLYEMQHRPAPPPPQPDAPKPRRKDKPYAPGYRGKRRKHYQERYQLTKQQPLTKAA